MNIRLTYFELYNIAGLLKNDVGISADMLCWL